MTSWLMYDVNGYNNTHYNCPEAFGEAIVRIQVRQGDKTYLKGYDKIRWNYISFFPNEWRVK